MPLNDNVMIEDARIIFKNFAGREQTYNSEGDRNFCIVLRPNTAEELKARGFNVKPLNNREPEDEIEEYVQVAVNYKKGRPPRVVIITSKGRTDLGADEVEMLDYADIAKIDVVLNPYPWEVSGKKGIKAYLKTAFVWINEDELELKYADMEEANPTKSSSTVNDEVA